MTGEDLYEVIRCLILHPSLHRQALCADAHLLQLCAAAADAWPGEVSKSGGQLELLCSTIGYCDVLSSSSPQHKVQSLLLS
jgi:hypothetical protein